MKKPLLFLILAAIFLLPKLSFAQTSCSCGPNPPADYGDASNKTQWCSCAAQCNDNGSLINGGCPQVACNPVSTYCGQQVYNHLESVKCESGQAFYESYQENNPDNCKGKIQCSTDNYKCPQPTTKSTARPTIQPTVEPTPTPTASPQVTNPTNTPVPSTSTEPSPTQAPKKPVRIIIEQFDQPLQTLDPSANLNEVKLHLNFDQQGIANVRFQVDYDYFGKDIKNYYVQYKLKQKPAENVSPSESQNQELKVLVLNYFSPGSDDIHAKARADSLTVILTNFLTEASKYHGYKDKNAQAALTYNVIETKEYSQSLPSSNYHIPWRTQAVLPDYMKVLTDQNVCDYVDNKGVKQVWIWSDHLDSALIDESNMSMGTDSQAFWNHGTYGDVSNSQQINDLPTCKKTYTLFNFNYTRSTGEMYESFGHQMEAFFRWIDNDLFWNKFVNPTGDNNGVNHCGWMHIPPNVKNEGHDYDWVNETTVKSDCEDWKPDGGGQTMDTNCHTWYQYTAGRLVCPKDSSGIATDGGAAFKIWWMQNFPGMNNSLMYKGNKMRNWWAFIGDFDSAIAAGKTLVEKSNKTTFSTLSVRSTGEQSDANYIPPAALSHPSYPPETSLPTPTIPQPTPTVAPAPLKLIDFNNDGVINIFDYSIFAQKKLLGR